MDPIACTTSRNFSVCFFSMLFAMCVELEAKSELGEFRNKASTWLRILPLVLTQAGSDAYAQRRGRRDRRGSIDRTGSYIIGVPGSLPFNISIFRLEVSRVRVVRIPTRCTHHRQKLFISLYRYLFHCRLYSPLTPLCPLPQMWSDAA